MPTTTELLILVWQRLTGQASGSARRWCQSCLLCPWERSALSPHNRGQRSVNERQSYMHTQQSYRQGSVNTLWPWHVPIASSFILHVHTIECEQHHLSPVHCVPTIPLHHSTAAIDSTAALHVQHSACSHQFWCGSYSTSDWLRGICKVVGWEFRRIKTDTHTKQNKHLQDINFLSPIFLNYRPENLPIPKNKKRVLWSMQWYFICKLETASDF